jgi:(1->4)-alpha-D-glucan 1-alpha-D-glucosylmutase
VRQARLRNPAVSTALFDFLRDMLLLRYSQRTTAEERTEQARFVGKFQQVTAPVMAKGVEDTAFYIYHRFLALNEVGGEPTRFGVPPEDLHRFFRTRQLDAPRALSATATHDTKRGEDLRARLCVLSEMPANWQQHVTRWRQLNEPLRVALDEETVPDRNEEYFLYQTLVGAWPPLPMTPEERDTFIRRLQDYIVKALHEAKVHSSWINPNTAYDEAFVRFVAEILDPRRREFCDDLERFVRQVNHFGLFNSLTQTLLKLTGPGVADTYQGTELWDFSLVDPDNRRPVDYGLRRKMLDGLLARMAEAGADWTSLTRELTEQKNDGRIKLFLTWRALRCGRDHPGLFTDGAYVPLETPGRADEHAFAFLRQHGDQEAIVCVPRLLARLLDERERLPLGEEVWGDTQIAVPEAYRGRTWVNVFTKERWTIDGTIAVGTLLAHFPAALLVAERRT